MLDDAYIQSRMRIAHIPGVALGVVRGDRVIYLKGYGIAGPDGRAVAQQNPFILGCTSKSFTALAVMQLVEAGKIDLDAPVTSYLPWFRAADLTATNQITVRNLLRFREAADYSANPDLMPDEPISGREAYQKYIDFTLPFITESGGGIALLGEGGKFFIGPQDE